MRNRFGHRRTWLTSCLAVLMVFTVTFTAATVPASAAPADVSRHAVVSSDAAAADIDTVQQAAGGWVYRDTYPDLIICHTVGLIYFPGRYRCEFFWFLWQLYVYYE
jgi:hypothetical protein